MTLEREEMNDPIERLLEACVEALAGYRREMGEHQPCDAEKAAREYLKDSSGD